MKNKTAYSLVLFLMMIFFCGYVQGQNQAVKNNITLTQDSLSLSDVLHVAIQTHPSVKEAEEVLDATNARIELARAGFYPDVDISATFAHIGPVPTVSLGTTSIAMAPDNNFNAALNVRQTIYDFGKTSKTVLVAKGNKNLEGMNVTLAKQRLTLVVMNTFYTLVFLQDAMLIKDKQLDDLNKHLELVKKEQETGSATKYEYLSTQVRISNTESQKIDLETNLKTQWVMMDMLTGMPTSFAPIVKLENSLPLINMPADSLFSYAYSRRAEIAVAKEKENQAALSYDLMKTSEMPVLSFIASGGAKNGYFPVLGDVKANYVLGLDLRIPLFDGYRKKNNLALAKSAMNTSGFETEMSRRNINNELVMNDANRLAAEKKIKQFDSQLALAEETYSLAQIKYRSGAITNLELLDKETEVSDSRLQLMKAKIDYIISIYKLKIALGDKPYEN